MIITISFIFNLHSSKMEKEVRILLEEPGYRKVVEHLESSLVEIQYQWNIFFDTPNLDLKKSRRILRLRSLKTLIINHSLAQIARRQHRHHHKDKSKKKDKKDRKERKEKRERKLKRDEDVDEVSEVSEVSEISQADVTTNSEQIQYPINISPEQLGIIPTIKTVWFITLKRPGVFKDGVASRPEKEKEISSELAQELIAHPSQIIDNVPKKIKKYLKDCTEWKNFEIVGDFINYRRVLSFENLIVEADETIFPNLSTVYEIEIETDDTQSAKQKIEQKMRELRISFVNSDVVKLARLLKLKPESRCSRSFSKQ